jgi:predicted aspartyl protease
MTNIHFSHAINYRSILGSPKRPYSPITLNAPSGSSVKIIGLIDSGADCCLFKPSVASSLGINWQSGTPIQIMGIEGTPSNFYSHTLDVQIDPMPSPKQCDVLFSNTVPENLIGRSVIFDSLYICFYQLSEKIYLESS